jgi:hypothetical protein
MICESTYAFCSGSRLVLIALFATTRKSRIPVMLAALWLCGSDTLLAQTFTTIFELGAGGSPAVGLVRGSDGNLCGSTIGGPGRGNGTIFKIAPSGTFKGLPQRRRLPRGADPGDRRELLRGERYEWARLWLGLQNDPEWHAHHAAHFRLYGWLSPRRGAGSS